MKFLLNSVVITILVLGIAVGAAYGMSRMDKGVNPPQQDLQEKPTEPIKKPLDRDSVKAEDGGIKGGNESAIKDGRLPSSAGKPTNTNPEVFSYKLNRTISFDSPTAEGTVMVENDPGNKNSMQLCIYLNDSQRLVYVSPMLDPNKHIDGDKLIARLNKGEYEATAVIGVYDTLSHAIETTIYEDVKLIVNDTWWNSIFGK